MIALQKIPEFHDPAPGVQPSDVVRALKALGGSAHQSLIADVVTGLTGEQPHRVRNDVHRILCEDARSASLFQRMYDPGSRRWMLVR